MIYHCPSCPHPVEEHSYQSGCTHELLIREDDQPVPYVCACVKQPGEIVGLV